MITQENFNENNRGKIIGNSLYKICRTSNRIHSVWYIHEENNTKNSLSGNNGFYSDNLQYVIDIINGFSKEKEVISLLY